MREIKFRAWVDNEMITPFVSLHEVQELMFVDFPRLKTASNIKWMQYTGLKDKNGVEIYEGDILGRSGYFSKVVTHNGINFESYSINNPEVKYVLDKYSFRYDEVIGNIYENSELL